jgi:hypothetical protein
MTPQSLDLFSLWAEISEEKKELATAWREALARIGDGAEKPRPTSSRRRPRRRTRREPSTRPSDS